MPWKESSVMEERLRFVARRLDGDPHHVSAIQPNDEEGMEQVEASRRDNEQSHGSNVRRGVPQKGVVSLTWRSTPVDHVLGDVRLRDFNPELEQLAVDARRSTG